VDPRAGVDDVEKRKFLTPPGLELRPLFRPARSSRCADYAIPAPYLRRLLCKNGEMGRKLTCRNRPSLSVKSQIVSVVIRPMTVNSSQFIFSGMYQLL
jgi:hypothetical protein